MLLVPLIYSMGLHGGWLFDDYPNIVDNQGVQPAEVSISALVRSALSSPASEFKRPLASLSFAANYLASGLEPYSWKLINLLIHLANGLLVFLLARALLQADCRQSGASNATAITRLSGDCVAALIASGWMLLPINLTAVLYVVQRMESMANFFVLLGLIGYIAGRRRMLATASSDADEVGRHQGWGGLVLCVFSIILSTTLGLLAKETAVMLPLYAALIEWAVFRLAKPRDRAAPLRREWRIVILFLLVLVLPLIVGMIWLLPELLKPEAWATRSFSLSTRLLSESRVVTDYIGWSLFPIPDALSFYHDDFHVSTGLLSPWTTSTSIVFLIALIAVLPWLRRRQPIAALGLALFLGCHLLTGTVLPLELVYEHRNYFASFGLLLALVPILAVPRSQPFALPRHALLTGLIVCWATLTAFTAYAWGDSLRLAEDLASRAPMSPRAQYELGRTYIIYSHYNPASPFTRLAYTPLEASAALPNSSILPEQALIFMNARMRLPLQDAWWNSMIEKLQTHTPGVQDESSLAALTQCARDRHCDLPAQRMVAAFNAALAHPTPSPRLFATYGDYLWNVLNDHGLGLQMIQQAARDAPTEPAYQITLVRMLSAQGRRVEAEQALGKLANLNIGGRLDQDLATLRALPGLH